MESEKGKTTCIPMGYAHHSSGLTGLFIQLTVIRIAMKLPRLLHISLLALVVLALNGCIAAALVGGGTATGNAALDQRSLGRHLDDAGISSMIDVRLIAERDLPSRWISAEVVRGQVVLTGYLPKQEQINRAIYICKHIRGVQSVRSEIHLGRPPARELVSDTLITTNVKRKIFNDTEVSGFTVHVETVGGKVYLQGVVSNASQRQRASTLAGEVAGVHSIVNLLHTRNER